MLEVQIKGTKEDRSLWDRLFAELWIQMHSGSLKPQLFSTKSSSATYPAEHACDFLRDEYGTLTVCEGPNTKIFFEGPSLLSNDPVADIARTTLLAVDKNDDVVWLPIGVSHLLAGVFEQALDLARTDFANKAESELRATFTSLHDDIRSIVAGVPFADVYLKDRETTPAKGETSAESESSAESVVGSDDNDFEAPGLNS